MYRLSISIHKCHNIFDVRLRMIEDGAVSVVPIMIQSLPNRENNLEFANHILCCIRNISESSGCRGELLIRGVIDILGQLMPYCYNDSNNQKLLIKTIHNLMTGTVFSNSSFDHAVKLVTSLIKQSSEEVTLQYGSACVNMFANENMRNNQQLTVNVIDVLPKLLECDHDVTKYYGIAATAQLLFNSMM